MECIIGGIKFKSLTDARNYTKGIYDTYDIGQTLSTEHTTFLISALHFRGQEGEQKIGCGVRRIYMISNEYGKKSFCIERNDGSETDFSYYKIFARKTGRVKKSDKRVDFEKACRYTVKDDILNIKNGSDSDIIAHHDIKQFKDIVDDFISENDIDVETIEFIGHDDGETHIEFADKNLEIMWRLYHRDVARISLVAVPEHKTLHRRR